MINTDKYAITNSRVIGMTLPFFARGKIASNFLEAIASPLVGIHKAFREWALWRLIEASITSQPMSLVWYLNFVFRSKFVNPEDSFVITTDNLEQNTAIWYLREQAEHEQYSPYLQYDSVGGDPWISPEKRAFVTRSIEEGMINTADIVIYAPEINITAKYDNTNYRNEIRSRVDRYMVCSVGYDVVIEGEVIPEPENDENDEEETEE